MTHPMPYEKFVVIVTYGRSGSTLLQTVLQSLPGAFIRGENNNALYPLFRSWKRAWGTRYNKGTEPNPIHGPWYGADEVVPRRFGEKLAAAFLEEIIAPPRGARVVGFKEIRFHDAEEGEFTEFLDFIRDFFPPCRLVFNTRRSTDVARSSWWKESEMDDILAMVEDLDRRYADYVAAHPEDCFLVRYEDYTRDRESLRPLFDFLGETFDADRLEPLFNRQLSH